MTNTTFQTIRPIHKEAWFKPYTMTLEVPDTGDKRIEVSLQSWFKKPLEQGVDRVARIANTFLQSKSEEQKSVTRRHGWVRYTMTPVSKMTVWF